MKRPLIYMYLHIIYIILTIIYTIHTACYIYLYIILTDTVHRIVVGELNVRRAKRFESKPKRTYVKSKIQRKPLYNNVFRTCMD